MEVTQSLSSLSLTLCVYMHTYTHKFCDKNKVLHVMLKEHKLDWVIQPFSLPGLNCTIKDRPNM